MRDDYQYENYRDNNNEFMSNHIRLDSQSNYPPNIYVLQRINPKTIEFTQNFQTPSQFSHLPKTKIELSQQINRIPLNHDRNNNRIQHFNATPSEVPIPNSLTQHLEMCLSNKNISMENVKYESEEEETFVNEFQVEEDEQIDFLYNINNESQKASMEKGNKRNSLIGKEVIDDFMKMSIEKANMGRDKPKLYQPQTLRCRDNGGSKNNFEPPPWKILQESNEMIIEEEDSQKNQRANFHEIGRPSFSDRTINSRTNNRDSKINHQIKSDRGITVTCTCKKSRCLKLYCECFASNSICGKNCSCMGCYNNDEFFDIRNQFVHEVSHKNPSAFVTKIKQIDTIELQLHSRGCNCKKTECLKDYCECHAAGISCTQICKCQDCGNFNDKVNCMNLEDFKEKVQRKRKRNDKTFDQILIEKLNSRKME